MCEISGEAGWRIQLYSQERLSYLQRFYTRANLTTSHPTYREHKRKDKKMVSSSPAPTFVDPSHVSVLGKVEGEKAVVQPETTSASKK